MMRLLRIILSNAWKIYAGVLFFITLLVFYPPLFVLLQFEKLKPLSFPINVCWSRVVRILCFYAVSTTGNPPKKGENYIIVANHTSYLDIFLLYSSLPNHPFLFLGKSELLKYPLIKTFFKKLNIPVDRSSRVKSAKSFIQAKKAIENGWSIVVFPEGGIFDDAPHLHPFKDGAFQLAKLGKCSLLPITFVNHYKLLSDPETLTGPAQPGIAKIHFHNEIPANEVATTDTADLNKNVFHLINDTLKKAIYPHDS